MGKYSIANTTKEDRVKFANDAQAMAELGGTPITKEDKALIQQYIDGEIEIDVLQRMAIAKYTKVKSS